MPHIKNFLLDGQKIPGVNDCTGTLSKDGLIENYFRRYGFKHCDKDSKIAKDRGSSLAGVMEELRIGKTVPSGDYNGACVAKWLEWFRKTNLEIIDDKWVEVHLVNTVHKYHGSPDGIFFEYGNDQRPVLGDDKSKKRFADYGLLMNEHAYAMCDSYVDPKDNLIKKVPWPVPIPTFWFWTYDPETAEMFSHIHDFDEKVWQDFLVCRQMYDVNAKAEEYFKQCATLLPSVQSRTNKASSNSLKK